MSAMEQSATLSAPVRAEAHRAYFIFGFRLTPDDTHGGGLASLASNYERWLLDMKLSAVLPSAQGDTPVWKKLDRETARKSLHQDLMPSVNSILHGMPAGGPAHEQPAPYGGDTPLRVSDNQMLGRCHLLPLSQAARKRLAKQGVDAETADNLVAIFEDITLYRPASGILLLAFGLRFSDLVNGNAPLPLPLVEEAIYALGHAADRGHTLCAATPDFRVCLEDMAEGDWAVLDKDKHFGLRKASPEELAKPALEGPLQPRRLLRPVAAGTEKQQVLFDSPLGVFSLNTLARQLLGCAASEMNEDASTESPDAHLATASLSRFPYLDELGPREHGRVFSFVAVQCETESDPATLRLAAYRLSRRFTIDYELAADDVARSVVDTFGNVHHALATQGASVVVRNTGPEFVGQFISTAAIPTYLPLALLSYHEYLHLIHLTQDCNFIPNRNHPEEDMEVIQSLRYELAKFRLFFRFSHVSDIAHHNRIHRLWRDALDLDRMLQELVLDVREADLVLERHHRELHAERWRLGGAIAAAVAGFLAALHILEAIFHLIFPDYKLLLLALKGDGLSWEEVEHDPRYKAAVEFFHHAHNGEYVVLAIAVLLAICAGLIAWKKGPHLEE